MTDSRPLSISSAPNQSVGVKVETGEITIVDEEDLEKVRQHVWRYVVTSRRERSRKRYLVAKGVRGPLYLHRLVTDAPKGTLVDHIDGNPLNNSKANLRFVTYLENARNRRPHQNEGRTSRYRGVCWDKKAGRWLASIFTKGVQYRLGWHDTQEAAARAYDDASIILHGLHGTRNFPNREPEPIELKEPEPKGNWRAEARRS